MFTVNATISFLVFGGTIVDFTAQAEHTYFAFMNIAVASATKNRTCVLVDLTTGQVLTSVSTSADNLVINPIKALAVSGAFTSPNRFYASFACGSVLVPPAVTPAATFFSIDQIMAGIADPWGLWYA